MTAPTITNGMRSIYPGEVLREEFLTPLKISANALSIQLRDLPHVLMIWCVKNVVLVLTLHFVWHVSSTIPPSFGLTFKPLMT